MTPETPQQLRKSAEAFAMEAYGKTKNNRAYALPEEGKVALGALARAMFIRRQEEGRSHSDAKPTPWQEFFSIIQRLADAGANILQRRPGEAEPLPKPWLDPVTNEPLPNPFDKTAPDLKAQNVLLSRDPALAEHYKAMASDPYGTLAKYQDAEAARIAMEAIPYGETEHSVNPFRTNDLQAQSLLVKNAPPGFAEFCKSEAGDVSIPLFGKNRNLTVESQLAKDPKTFALMKTAQQIRETWRAEDARAAQARRASAEDEIRRLSEVAA